MRTIKRAMYLPTSPDDEEKYCYFKNYRRWIFAWILVAAAGVLYGYIHVVERAWLVAPVMWLLLAVMVPPVVVNFWLRIGKPRTSLEDHLAVVAAYRPGNESVDVFLPSCGEPLEVLENTFGHVRMLSWHGPINVYVLDDSASDAVRALTERYGFNYVVRDNRPELKKAGNLIHALGVTGGDYIMVLDADFAVRSDFLKETVPYFDDAKVGIVQTAQYFDTTNRRFTYIQRYAGALQEIFFRYIQPARDRYKAAICAGTNLVYRRAAVEAAGGFARVPIGEDVHSGVKLWWAGYETRYVPLCLARGVAPEDFPSLANQQTRWCRSSMLLMVEDHFREAPFNWRQRAAFWAAFLYYMSSAALLLTAPFPTLTMLWFFPKLVHAHNYLPMLPALVASLCIFPLMTSGWRPTIYRVCIINSCCHVYAIYYALLGRVAEWVPTGASKKKDLVPRMVNRILCFWIITTQGLFWSALALRIAQSGWQTYWATLLLGVVQVYMLAPLLTRDKGVRLAGSSAHARRGFSVPRLSPLRLGGVFAGAVGVVAVVAVAKYPTVPVSHGGAVSPPVVVAPSVPGSSSSAAPKLVVTPSSAVPPPVAHPTTSDRPVAYVVPSTHAQTHTARPSAKATTGTPRPVATTTTQASPTPVPSTPVSLAPLPSTTPSASPSGPSVTPSGSSTGLVATSPAVGTPALSTTS